MTALAATGTGVRRRPTQEQVRAFIRLGRFKFLMESLVTVALGVAVSVWSGQPFRISGWLLAQAFVSGTHLMTHYCNEYFDLAADSAQTAPTEWTGGSRVLAGGHLSPQVSLSAAFVMLFAMVGVITAMPAAGARAIGAVILALAWFYTAPPLRLNYRALGEVATSLVLTILTPALVCYLQAGRIPALLPAVAVPLFLVMAARMAVMNLVDHEADLTVGKQTVATRLGIRRTAWLFVGAQVAAYGTAAAATALGVLPLPVGVVLLATAPLAWLTARRLFDDPLRDTSRSGRTALLATVHAAVTCYAATAALVALTLGELHHQPTGSVLAGAGLLALYTVLQIVDRTSGLVRRKAARRGDTTPTGVPA